MNKYKVQITKTYCIDVKAIDQRQAQEKADTYLFNSLQEGMGHYLEAGDQDVVVFDITNTDDNFNSI